MAWLAQAHPRARLGCEPCGKRALRWEYRWLGSHRYAVLNLAAADLDTLRRDGDECARRLFGVPLPAGVEADAAPLPMTGCS